ncbi:type IV secretory system conjugative DNA transfer family protein [Streptosporangium canum]|uniref:type IV secretory system conjugative DNA transfer family protein n=1 Tax=Streptosporangium canum TaxID=324952 RepID=UPI0037B3A83A
MHLSMFLNSPLPDGTIPADLPLPDIENLLLHYWWILVLLLIATVALGLVVKRMQDPHLRRGLALVWRLKLRMHPGPGFADRFHLWRHYGRPPALRIARRARPSLGGWWSRHTAPTREYTTFMGWAQGWVWRIRVYATLEDITLVIAPPKEGKSAWASGRIVDAPGAVVATSIRGDLVDETAGLRGELGRVHTFNPEQVGHWASTFRWSPVPGSEDPQTAIRRAAHMVSAADSRGVTDQSFWDNQGAQVLAAMLHAAALAECSIVDIYRWVVTNDTTPVKILSMRWPGLDTELAAAIVHTYLTTHDRTRDSIALTLRNCLRAVEAPVTRWAITPEASENFDIERFLANGETLYLIASDSENTPVPPLFAAIMAEIHHTATRMATYTAHGRLDPPLTMVLDEVANICPVPLDYWSTTASGYGITMVLLAQSWSQIEKRWRDGADTIWNAAKMKAFYPATSWPEDLERISWLCGEVSITRWDETRDRDGKTKRTKRREVVRVLPAEQIRMLPSWRAVVVRGNAKPTIVRIEKIWSRADYKRWRRAGGVVALPRLDREQQPQLSRGDEITQRRLARTLDEPPPLRFAPPPAEDVPSEVALPRAVPELPADVDALKRNRRPGERRPWDRHPYDGGEQQ